MPIRLKSDWHFKFISFQHDETDIKAGVAQLIEH